MTHPTTSPAPRRGMRNNDLVRAFNGLSPRPDVAARRACQCPQCRPVEYRRRLPEYIRGIA